MAYQAKRTSMYTQDFELVDEMGQVVHKMKVELDPDSIVKKLSEQYINLIHAQENLSSIRVDEANVAQLAEKYELLGNALVVMIESVFGKEHTDIIVEFYKNRYNDMIVQVLPFIINVVLPDLRSIAKQNKKEILKKYNRKFKHSFNKKAG